MPITARSLGGCVRLLDDPHQSLAFELGDAKLTRVRHALEEDAGLVVRISERAHVWDDALCQKVVAEKRDERTTCHGLARCADGVCDAARPSLCDISETGSPRPAIAGGAADLVAGLGGHDDRDVAHAGFNELFDAVEQDRLVGDRDELLCAGVGERTEAASLAAADY